MFHLTAEAEYGYLALIKLAEVHASGGSLKLAEIILDKGLSDKFMLQVLTQLKRVGLVSSVRGKHGGYRLARSPTLITLADLLSATVGHNRPGERAFPVAGERSFLARWWKVVLESIGDLGRNATLAEALEAEKGHQEIMYYI